MCFGYDGDRALRDSLDQKGASRRSLLRGAAISAGAVAALGTGVAAPAVAQARGQHHGSRRHSIPHERISIQMYTLRDATDAETLPMILHRLAQYGYEKVELAGYYGLTARDLRKALAKEGIRASSSHDGLSERNKAALHAKLSDAVTLGQQYVVVPYLNDPSPDYWKDAAEQMNEEAAVAKEYGLRYGYHNHAHEFTTDLGGGVTPWEVLTSRLDPSLVHLEVDLYWVYTGGVNSGASDPDRFAIDVIRRAPQQVRQFHVKDRDATGDMCDLGTGVVDFPRIFRTHEVEEYIVENDTPDVTPLTTAAVGHLYLDHLEY
jgi:sugar phosphate isomerase/epimerase